MIDCLADFVSATRAFSTMDDVIKMKLFQLLFVLLSAIVLLTAAAIPARMINSGRRQSSHGSMSDNGAGSGVRYVDGKWKSANAFLRPSYGKMSTEFDDSSLPYGLSHDNDVPIEVDDDDIDASYTDVDTDTDTDTDSYHDQMAYDNGDNGDNGDDGDDGPEQEFALDQPYGIQNVRDLGGDSGNGGSLAKRVPRPKNGGGGSGGRGQKITFQSLCPSRRELVFLNLNSRYEYHPDHFEEVICTQPFKTTTVHGDVAHTNRNKVCGEVGFSCIQLNRTIYLTRQLPGSGCWESETRLVAAGCECMWPKHHLGDINAFH